MLYISAPYTHESPLIISNRVAKVNSVFAKFLAAGIHSFSPITKGHGINEMYGEIHGFTWDHWMKYDLRLLKECHVMIVLKLEGWSESKGIQAEVAFAHLYGIPIVFLEEKDVDRFISAYANRKLVVLTGAPGTGKTEFMKLAKRMNVPIHESGDPLRDMFARLVGQDKWNDDLESAKRLDRDFGVSISYKVSELESMQEMIPSINTKVRQGIIHLAEKVVKPILGLETFPRHASKLLNQYIYSPVLVTAAAFNMELDCLRQEFIGEIMIVELMRNGKNYKEDSREPLKPDIIISNDGTLEEYQAKVRKLINELSDSSGARK